MAAEIDASVAARRRHCGSNNDIAFGNDDVSSLRTIVIRRRLVLDELTLCPCGIAAAFFPTFFQGMRHAKTVTSVKAAADFIAADT